MAQRVWLFEYDIGYFCGLDPYKYPRPSKEDPSISWSDHKHFHLRGFSENDTFRSNQIREGMISREKALALVYDENKPRYNSLKWYMEIIGLDFVDVIKIVNKIPRLY